MIMVGTSLLILLVDLGIKASILEEATSLRSAINHMAEDCHDPTCPGVHYDTATKANATRASNNGNNLASVLDLDSTRMEDPALQRPNTRTGTGNRRNPRRRTTPPYSPSDGETTA